MPTFNGTNNADTIFGTSLSDTIFGNLGADSLFGGGGNDAIFDNIDGAPDTFADVLDGGDGDDWMSAGYSDTVRGGAGIDTLLLYLQFAPTAIIADWTNLWFGATATLGGANISGFERIGWIRATEFDDTMILGTPFGRTAQMDGMGGADILQGGPGTDYLYAASYFDTANDTAFDRLWGEGGDDFLVAGMGDRVDGGTDIDSVELDVGLSATGVTLNFATLISTGTDTLAGTLFLAVEHVKGAYGSAHNDLFDAGLETFDMRLLGRAGDDILAAGAGADTLDGGTGADFMVGRDGNDTYYVDNAADIVSESVGGGDDTVNATTSTTLAINVERLNLLGSAAIDGTTL